MTEATDQTTKSQSASSDPINSVGTSELLAALDDVLEQVSDDALPIPLEQLERVRSILRGKLHWELKTRCQTPWLIMMAGGTNVGKSELFNALVQQQGALPDARGAQTKHPLAWLHEDDLTLLEQVLGEAWSVEPLDDHSALNTETPVTEQNPFYVLTHGDAAWRGCCLIDTPDFDSDHLPNRAKSLELAGLCDGLVFTTIADKYNDRLSVQFLSQALAEIRRLYLLFNLATDENRPAQDDFEQTVVPGCIDESKDDQFSEIFPRETRLYRIAPEYDAATRHDRLKEKLDELRGELLDAAQNREALKKTMVRRIGELTLQQLEELHRDLHAPWEEIARLETALKQTADEFQAALDDYYREAPFHEFDAIFTEMLKQLEVPYLDQFLSWTGDLMVKTGRLVGLEFGDGHGGKTSELARQRSDREVSLAEEFDEKSCAVIDATVENALKKPAQDESDEVTSPAEWVADVDEARELEQYIQETQNELNQMVEERPRLRKALIAGRTTLLAGGGLGVALATGGLGRLDLILAPASAALIKQVIERIGRSWIDQRRSQYFKLRGELLKQRLADTNAARMEQLKPSANRDALTNLETEMSKFDDQLARL
jgi:DNA-binding protein Fis